VIYNFVGHIIRTVRLLVALSTNSSPQSVPVLFQKYVYKNAAIYIYIHATLQDLFDHVVAVDF
jgi:hypothetical protein